MTIAMTMTIYDMGWIVAYKCTALLIQHMRQVRG